MAISPSAMHADLHTHTSFSDGLKTPAQVVDAAIDAGVTCLAITDHDTMDGYFEARDYLLDDPSISAELRLIGGIEMSCRMDARDVHMLGYFIDELSSAATRELREARRRRRERSLSIADNLARDGYPISREALTRSGKTINRTAIARTLVDAGAAGSVADVFDNLIGEGCPYHVPREDLSAVRAIELILDSGGIPVMAHPALYHVTDLIEPLMRVGLRGVEAYHSDQTPEESAELVRLADSLGLLVTGGSDWHGDPLHAASIGEVELPDRYLKAFLEADPHRRGSLEHEGSEDA